MSKQYVTSEATPREPASKDGVAVPGETKPNHDVKVVSLEVDDDNFGSDPYNRTGTFFMPEFVSEDE